MASTTELSNMIDWYKRKINANNEKILRLKLVYDELGSIKSNFRNAKNETKSIFYEKGIWRGDRYKEFCRDGDKLNSMLSDYYKQLDAVQDAINKKIAELKAENTEWIPIIGSLRKQIIDLECAIQNATN